MKIALLVVENREMVLLDYMKFVLYLAVKQKIQNVRFWTQPQRRAIWWTRREMIRSMLKETDCTHALFIDTDVIPSNDVVERLAAHDKAMVSGFYCDQQGTPCTRKNGEPYLDLNNGLEEVDVFSMGLSLIRRDVLEAVEYPTPEPAYKMDGDTEFCKKAKEAGFQPYVDFSLRGEHLLLKSC